MMNQPTQADVAQYAGVSRATVSYVLNGNVRMSSPISDETQQRVLEAIKELGYEPDARAQVFRSGSTNTIVLTIPDLRNPHFGEMQPVLKKRPAEPAITSFSQTANLYQ